MIKTLFFAHLALGIICLIFAGRLVYDSAKLRAGLEYTTGAITMFSCALILLTHAYLINPYMMVMS